jgi:ATP-binding protein involved in chromosome partitioning
MSECDTCNKEECASCAHNPNKPDAQDIAITNFLSHVKHKYVVMSGKGGVGKSTVATDIALLLAQKGFKVGLLDVDLHGPSIAGLLGLTGQPLTAIGDKMIPYHYNENLFVMTIQGLMPNKDDALIWRGPVKIGVIRQFLSDTQWPALDYLIIDCPPGTGDEPLTVIQTIKDIEAIIVTTPQKIALDDVRKSVSFCQIASVKIAGIVENMSGLVCPHCHQVINLFKTGGGENLAKEKNLPFLGKLPLDPAVVDSDDAGSPLDAVGEATKTALDGIVNKLVNGK